MDEPHTVPGKAPADWQHLHIRASALHAVDPTLRSLVTTEFCEEFQDANGSCVIPPDVVAANRSGDITLWVPMMPFVAGRSDIPKGGQSGKGANVHCKDVPLASQRHEYDFIAEPERHLWWYLACFAEGGCCAGPQRKCTAADRVALAGTCSVPCFMGWYANAPPRPHTRKTKPHTHAKHAPIIAPLTHNQLAQNAWDDDQCISLDVVVVVVVVVCAGRALWWITVRSETGWCSGRPISMTCTANSSGELVVATTQTKCTHALPTINVQ